VPLVLVSSRKRRTSGSKSFRPFVPSRYFFFQDFELSQRKLNLLLKFREMVQIEIAQMRRFSEILTSLSLGCPAAGRQTTGTVQDRGVAGESGTALL
jgi:hypothetical protein